MTLADLIAQARVDLDDAVAPYLWSDTDLLGYINWAIDTLAEGAFLIYDDYTPEICGPISIAAEAPYFTKDPRIIEIRELRLTPVPEVGEDAVPYQYPLTKRSREWLEHHYPTWPTAEPGQPQIYCENMRVGAVRLIPVPEVAVTANMIVYRRPLTPLTLADLTASPEIEVAYHKFLRYGPLSRAYLKTDNEAYDPGKAIQYQNAFLGSNDGKITGDVQRAFRLKHDVELQVSETIGVNKAFC